MKNFLRFLLILLAVIIVGVLILGLVEPKDITVQRSTVINAPKDAVFEQIVKFKNWPHWSPWYDMDSSMQITYYGQDGQVGSGYHWVGDKKKTGTGDMKNAGLRPGEMDYDLAFLEPREGKAQGTFSVVDATNGVKVNWMFKTHMSFPWNAMCAFMNMDKMLGSDFERGLAKLKVYTEANSSPSTGTVVIQEVQFPGHTYEGMRSTVSWNDIGKFCGDSYSKLGKEAGPRIAGPAAGLFYKWDTVAHNTDMAAVFPVSDTSKMVAGTQRFHVPAGGAYMAIQKGGYSNSMMYHTALGQYAVQKGKKVNLVVEEYISGPGQEKDSTKWVTNIYYLHD